VWPAFSSIPRQYAQRDGYQTCAKIFWQIAPWCAVKALPLTQKLAVLPNHNRLTSLRYSPKNSDSSDRYAAFFSAVVRFIGLRCPGVARQTSSASWPMGHHRCSFGRPIPIILWRASDAIRIALAAWLAMGEHISAGQPRSRRGLRFRLLTRNPDSTIAHRRKRRERRDLLTLLH